MATAWTRKQLQEWKAVREEEARQAMIARDKEIWDTHVENSVDYIYNLILGNAEEGKTRLAIHNLNTREPYVIEEQNAMYKHNSRAAIAYRVTCIGSTISSHDGSSISILCLPDILKRLSALFPDSCIEVEGPSSKNGGQTTLCIDWA